MSLLGFCLFLFVTVGALPVSAQCGNCKSLEEVDRRLNCLQKLVASGPKNSSSSRDAVLCTIEEWKKRDGAIGFDVSDAFLNMMKMDPEAFFGEMARNEAAFLEWQSELGNLSFTWFKDPPSPLEKKRKRLIRYLSELKELDGKEDVLRKQLLSTLRKTKSRQID